MRAVHDKATAAFRFAFARVYADENQDQESVFDNAVGSGLEAVRRELGLPLAHEAPFGGDSPTFYVVAPEFTISQATIEVDLVLVDSEGKAV
jgi:hypothetical protein